jgi:hypothetical protein
VGVAEPKTEYGPPTDTARVTPARVKFALSSIARAMIDTEPLPCCT